MAKKRNIFIVGLMGVGKTSIGKALAQELHLNFYDSDSEIERRSGANIPWIFDLEGEEGFRARETKVIDDLTQLDGVVIATGGGAVLRAENRRVLSARGIVIYLHANIEDLLERTSRNQNRPLLTNKDPREILQKLLAVREPLYREIADFIYDTSNRSVGDITADIVADFRKKKLFA